MMMCLTQESQLREESLLVHEVEVQGWHVFGGFCQIWGTVRSGSKPSRLKLRVLWRRR